MSTVPESKSQEKRLAAQQPERYELPKRIEAVEKRLDEIEALLTEAFTFVADEMRPLYGNQRSAAIFQAVADRLSGKK